VRNRNSAARDFVPQLIVGLDSGGKRIHANRVFRGIHRSDPEELRSEDAVESLVHPDDVERMRSRTRSGDWHG